MDCEQGVKNRIKEEKFQDKLLLNKQTYVRTASTVWESRNGKMG